MRSATASSTQRSPSTSPVRAIAASKPENLPTRRRTAKNRRLRLSRQLTHGGSNPRKSAGPNTGNPAFRDYLFRQGTEIMVLGYGFADAYINELLLEAARNYALRMYLINPAGTRAYSAHGGLSASGRNELLEIPLLGVCGDTPQG